MVYVTVSQTLPITQMS